jgi:hypothetical protein
MPCFSVRIRPSWRRARPRPGTALGSRGTALRFSLTTYSPPLAYMTDCEPWRPARAVEPEAADRSGRQICRGIKPDPGAQVILALGEERFTRSAVACANPDDFLPKVQTSHQRSNTRPRRSLGFRSPKRFSTPRSLLGFYALATRASPIRTATCSSFENTSRDQLDGRRNLYFLPFRR